MRRSWFKGIDEWSASQEKSKRYSNSLLAIHDSSRHMTRPRMTPIPDTWHLYTDADPMLAQRDANVCDVDITLGQHWAAVAVSLHQIVTSVTWYILTRDAQFFQCHSVDAPPYVYYAWTKRDTVTLQRHRMSQCQLIVILISRRINLVCY